MDPLEFLSKYKKEIHESLNHLWEMALELREVFNQEYQVSKLTPAFNNYILVNGKWLEQKYPIPSFRFSIGEVSVNLEFISAVIGIYSNTLNEKFLETIVKYADIEVYGGRNFLHTFYESSMKIDPKDLLRNIRESGEEVIQLEIKTKHTRYFKLLKEVKHLDTLIRKHKIKVVQPLRDPT